MSELTIEYLRKYLPVLDQLIEINKDKPHGRVFEGMKNNIVRGKKLPSKVIENIEKTIIKLARNVIITVKGSMSERSIENNKNNKMEVICLSSDDETTSSRLPYHKENEVVEIKTNEPNQTRMPNGQQVVIKPESPDVEIITTTIQTNNITPDTDSQKISIKPERCEVETIIKEVKLTADHNGNSQLNNSNIVDIDLTNVKEEEPESEIDDEYMTVYSGSSGRSPLNTVSENVASQTNDDDDVIMPPSSAKRKRRKISSSSEVSDVERNKERQKRRRILQYSDSSDDERVSKAPSSTSSRRKKRVNSHSSTGSEFYSAESTKSVEKAESTKSVRKPKKSENPAQSQSAIADTMKTLENFREAIHTVSKNHDTTNATKISNLMKEAISKEELPKMTKFLQSCCEKGILTLNIESSLKSRNYENILIEFVDLTLNPTRQLRNRVVPIVENDQTSSDEESSENSVLDFSDDQDYQCSLNRKDKSRESKRMRHKNRKGELDKLKEDIDKSFIKPALLTLKPREHKNVDYAVDTKATSSDDSDAFVNSISKDNPQSSMKKKRGRRRASDARSSKSGQSRNSNDSDESAIGVKKALKTRRLVDFDSDRTTPDNLVGNIIGTVKNEENESNRSTPDIDLKNDPRVMSIENSKNILSDMEIDTECSSGGSVTPRHIFSPSDEDEDEKNPKWHFITVEKITGCKVKVNKLDIFYKPEPYKVRCENGVWKISKAPSKKSSKVPNDNNLELSNTSNIPEDVKHVSEPSTSNDQLASNKPKESTINEISNSEDHVNTTVKENDVDEEDAQKTETNSNSPQESCNNVLENNLFYDPISESEDEFINMEPNENIGECKLTLDFIDEDEKIDETLSDKDSLQAAKDPLQTSTDPLKISTDPIISMISSVTEEKYKIQEDSFYDPISSESEDDALHIDMDAETRENDNNKNDKNSLENGTNQHPAANSKSFKAANSKSFKDSSSKNKSIESNSKEIVTINDSEEIVAENSIQKAAPQLKPKISIVAKKPNSTLKEKLNKNINTSAKIVKQTSPKSIKTKRSPQKNKAQQLINLSRNSSPMSKLLTENERKVLNLSYISCRGGYQFRCLNSCKYYNLREDAFKYHILSRHASDKWAGFCNLCGKSFFKDIRPLFDEYEHMIKYHIIPEHEQRVSSKENIATVDVNDSDKDDNDSDCIILSQPTESNTNISNENVPVPIIEPKSERKEEQSIPKDNNDHNQEHDQSNPSDSTKSSLQQEIPTNDQNKVTEPEAPSNQNAERNNEQVQQNVDSIPENPQPKQILRVKSLPGDKLSGKNEEKAVSDKIASMLMLNPEMTFGEMTDLERRRQNVTEVKNSTHQPSIQESLPSQITPPMTPLPEGCVPETTPEQEATLQAVIEENISRYDQPNVQPQQPVTIRTASNLQANIQPNSIVLSLTNDALFTFTLQSSYNSNTNNVVSTTQAVTNQNFQPPPYSQNNLQSFLTKQQREPITKTISSTATCQQKQQNISNRPTAACQQQQQNFSNRPTATCQQQQQNISNRPTATCQQQNISNDIERVIPSNVIMPNTGNAQNPNPYVNEAFKSTNYMNTNQAPQDQAPAQITANPLNSLQSLVSTNHNQVPSTSQGKIARNPVVLVPNLQKTRELRPWLNKEDLKTKDALAKCFEKKYLMQLYKCMFVPCSFATNDPTSFSQHLVSHQIINNPLIFNCSYCTFNTTYVNVLIDHITEKYNQCKYYCSRCFYRTCSQFNAVKHTILAHKSFGFTSIFANTLIQAVQEDQEFKKIRLRELPMLVCVGCPQVLHTYDHYRIHVRQCLTSSTIICNKCQQTTSANNIEKHQVFCNGVYTFNCCYCQFGSQSLDNMSEHLTHSHLEKIPFYIERCDTSHLSTPLQKKAALIKKFSSSKFNMKIISTLKK